MHVIEKILTLTSICPLVFEDSVRGNIFGSGDGFACVEFDGVHDPVQGSEEEQAERGGDLNRARHGIMSKVLANSAAMRKSDTPTMARSGTPTETIGTPCRPNPAMLTMVTRVMVLLRKMEAAY